MNLVFISVHTEGIKTKTKQMLFKFSEDFLWLVFILKTT